MIKKIKIKNKTLKNNVFVAPLAGYTDVGFRALMAQTGVACLYTEMISAKGLCFNSKKTRELLYIDNANGVETGVQLFGGEAEYIEKAIKLPELKDFYIIDINLGCPVHKIVNNFEGSALLKTPDVAFDIVQRAVKAAKSRAVTVKMRTGFYKGEDISLEFAKAFESAGVSAITIHGRTKEDYYSGDINYAAIRKVKENTKIPIIANGNIFTVQDAKEMFQRTGADGIMLARGVIGNPHLAADIMGLHFPLNKMESLAYQIKTSLKYFPEQSVFSNIKKVACAYFKNEPNSTKTRKNIVESKNLEKLLEFLNINI